MSKNQPELFVDESEVVILPAKTVKIDLSFGAQMYHQTNRFRVLQSPGRSFKIQQFMQGEQGDHYWSDIEFVQCTDEEYDKGGPK